MRVLSLILVLFLLAGCAGSNRLYHNANDGMTFKSEAANQAMLIPRLLVSHIGALGDLLFLNPIEFWKSESEDSK